MKPPPSFTLASRRSTSRLVPLLAVLALLLPGTVSATAAGPWTVDDLLLAESASGLRVSPDGRLAVWAKVKMDKEEGKRISNLVLTRLDTGEEIPLTRGRHRDASPRFSPDGKWIAFVSDRDLPDEDDDDDPASRQIWLIRTDGGGAWPLTRGERAPGGFIWRDAGRIVFSTQETADLAEALRDKGEDTSQPVEDVAETAPIRLFEVAVQGGKVRRLTRNTDWIEDFEVSPDGRWVVMRRQQSLSFNYDEKVPPKTFLMDLVDGGETEILQGTRLQPNGFFWARDSTGFYLTNSYSSHPQYRSAAITQLHYVDLESRRPVQVDLDWERALGRGRILVTPDGFLALLADGVRFQPARYVKRAEGWARQDLTGTHATHLWDWDLSSDGKTLVYEHSTPSKPEQWFRASLTGNSLTGETAVTKLNPSFEAKPKHRTEIVRWNGALGEEVEGILYYPLAYLEGARHPLVLAIHGGPAGVDLDQWDQSWAYPKLLIAQEGAFLLEVNYHGSANYGLEWVESIGGGKYYELEIPDIENGVDRLIERGLVDPDRLATLGWSNGGILSAELITRTRRYKAASIGAADVEWISDWANVDFGAGFDNYYFGASPLENPQLYIDKSPFFRLPEVTTPTIVYTGTEDRNVPPSQSWSLFRALQQTTDTPVRFLLFPGEPHGLGKYAHQKRKTEEDLAWLRLHLFRKEAPSQQAIKKGSPLQVALQRAKAKRSGAAFGELIDDVLVPETVSHKGLRVGRFELTRAQLAAFDSSVDVQPGTENLPATGLSRDRIDSYLTWLSERTGATYRLPTKAEAAKLYGKAGGNVLDAWAGYAPNPEDAERLRAAAAKLPGAAPLLKPVGSHPGTGKNPVFDLDGNAAEWVQGKEDLELAGGSADRSSDAMGSGRAGEAYRGVRVVREAG